MAQGISCHEVKSAKLTHIKFDLKKSSPDYFSDIHFILIAPVEIYGPVQILLRRYNLCFPFPLFRFLNFDLGPEH